MKKQFWIVALCLFSIGNISAAGFDDSYQKITRLELGDALPTYSLKNLDSQHVSFNVDQKATLISIFTTWCSVCKVELKHLNKDFAYIQEKELPIDIMVINAGESKKKVIKYKKRRSLSMPILIDKKLDMMKDFQVLGTPAILIFDKDNTLVYQGSDLPKDWIETLTAQ